MELLRTLESLRTPWFDTFFGTVTRLGEEMILIFVFCALYWCISKRHAYVMGAVFFVSSLAVQGLKVIFRVPRPWVYDPAFTTVTGAEGAATGYAFPSGHTQNAAAWTGSLAAMLSKIWVKITLVVLALLVAFSRMYLGVHYLSDVLVSLVITFAIVWVAVKVIPAEAKCIKREAAIAGFIFAAAVVVLVIVAVSYHNNMSEARQLRDAARAAGAAIAFAVGFFVERNYIKFPVRAQNYALDAVKLILGIAVALGIQEGSRLLGTSLPVEAIRYFLIVTWIMVLYPLIIVKFFKKKGAAHGS